MGAPAPSAVNPYPIRTMIGNMVFRLRQHKTPIMVIPPLIRMLYQFRRPLMAGFNSAIKGISGSPGGAAAAGAMAAKGASDLASAGSNPLSAAVAGPAFGANPGFMFPGPMMSGLPGAFGPGGLMSPFSAASSFTPVFA